LHCLERISLRFQSFIRFATFSKQFLSQYLIQNVAEFSTEAAIEYLKSSTGAMRQKAFNYIATAPATIKTPVRAMAKELFGL
jgi:hypothetical protein